MTLHIKAGPGYKIKIANRIRFTIFISLSISLILLLVFPPIMYAVNKPMLPSLNPGSPYKVSVRAGDTLWDIAKVHLPPKTDIRDFIHEIKTINHLESSFIKEGDTLYIPHRP